MPKLGPRSAATRLTKLDGRTQLAKRAKRLRDELRQHVGGNPSATQMVLIDRAVMLQTRIDMLDKQTLDGHEMNDGDGRRYLAWTNSLTRLMRQLGQKSAAPPVASLSEYLAGRLTP
jgi:hypothetical protein